MNFKKVRGYKEKSFCYIVLHGAKKAIFQQKDRNKYVCAVAGCSAACKIKNKQMELISAHNHGPSESKKIIRLNQFWNELKRKLLTSEEKQFKIYKNVKKK